MKEAVDPLAAASHILKALPDGILLNIRSGQRVNTWKIYRSEGTFHRK